MAFRSSVLLILHQMTRVQPITIGKMWITKQCRNPRRLSVQQGKQTYPWQVTLAVSAQNTPGSAVKAEPGSVCVEGGLGKRKLRQLCHSPSWQRCPLNLSLYLNSQWLDFQTYLDSPCFFLFSLPFSTSNHHHVSSGVEVLPYCVLTSILALVEHISRKLFILFKNQHIRVQYSNENLFPLHLGEEKKI